MKNLIKFFRGNGKKEITNEEILKEIKDLNTNICDKNFDLLEDVSKTKDKYFKLDAEHIKSLELMAEREKYCHSLEENLKLKEKFNELEESVNLAIKKLDSLSDILAEFKGNVYEIKRVRSCIGSKQKIQAKSSSRNSSIIKNVVGVEDEQ